MAASLVEQVDGTLEQLLASWNIWSYLLSAALLAYLVSPLFLTSEPDTHPLLLARQAASSAVRQPGESAVYRSLEAPHGYPLRSGLGVRDPGAPKWTAGRDGDLRDIWKEALSNKSGKMLSLKGKLDPIEHSLEDLTKEISAIGHHIQLHQGTRVAIYLPNSVELLSTLFAAAFFNFVPILIPLHQPLDDLFTTLRETKADVLVAAAGVISPGQFEEAKLKLKNIIWVVEQTSRQVDWQQDAIASEWHALVEAKSTSTSSSTELPSFEGDGPNVICVGNTTSGTPNITEFTQKNIVAAVAAQINALPRSQRLSDSDMLLSLEPMTSTFALCLTLAALHSHATIALTTVAGASPDFDLAFQRIKPTVVIAPAETLSEAHARKDAAAQGLFQKLQRHQYARSLAAGTMIKANINSNLGPRLIYTSSRAGEESIPLSPQELSNLRILTGARIVHALTASQVAGSVTQSNALDYRVDDSLKRAHLGAPVSAVEIKLIEGKGLKIPDDGPEENHVGEIVVTGPSVIGGQANIGVLGKFGSDSTLRLA